MAAFDGNGYYYVYVGNNSQFLRSIKTTKYTGIQPVPYSNIKGTSRNIFYSIFWNESVSGSASDYTEYDTDGSVILTWGYKFGYGQGLLFELDPTTSSFSAGDEMHVTASSKSKKLIKHHQGYDSSGLSYGIAKLSGVYSSAGINLYYNPLCLLERDRFVYTITYDPGSQGAEGKVTQTILEDEVAKTKYAIFTSDTHIQDGWSTTDCGDKKYDLNADISLASNITLYPHWGTIERTITFNPNGGSVSQTSKNVIVGEVYGSLPIPTYEGYEFQGWYTSSGNLVTAYSIVLITDSDELIAHWEKIVPKTKTITFDPTGGSVSPITKVVTIGEEYGTLPTPIRSGYTFLRWVNGDGKTIAEDTIVEENDSAVLSAVWHKDEPIPPTPPTPTPSKRPQNQKGYMVFGRNKTLSYSPYSGSLLYAT